MYFKRLSVIYVETYADKMTVKNRPIASYTTYMRYIVIVALLLATVALVPAQVHAQTCCYDTAMYEFENEIAAMLYTGTWSTSAIYSTASATARVTTVLGSSVSFRVDGSSVIIWRYVRPSGQASRMDVCVNGVCIPVNNESSASWASILPVTLMTAPGDLVTVTHTLGTVALDSFMVLEDPVAAGAYPTPVPTATILPSSTPAYTATPGPTPVNTATAVPTATPYTLPHAVWAIDPAARYGSTNGQITKQTYGMETTDYMMLYLLAALLGVNVIQIGLTIWKRK